MLADGFYKVARNQGFSFCKDIFYNPENHFYYTLRTSDSDDYEILSHFWSEHEEPINYAIRNEYINDDKKVEIDRNWNNKYTLNGVELLIKKEKAV